MQNGVLINNGTAYSSRYRANSAAVQLMVPFKTKLAQATTEVMVLWNMEKSITPNNSYLCLEAPPALAQAQAIARCVRLRVLGTANPFFCSIPAHCAYNSPLPS